MKHYSEIRNEINQNTNKIGALESAADKLMRKEDIRTAATHGAIKTIRNGITEADEAEAVKLYTEAEELKRINKILAENEKAAFMAYAEPIIKEIMQKYNGKQYGEKTREKIRNEAYSHGISFYFSGYRSQDTITIYCLREDGCRSYNAPEVTAYARKENQRAEFISEKNTIQDISDIDFSHSYTYTEDPSEKQNKINEAFEEYKKLVALASEAQCKLNSLLPANSKHFNTVGNLSPWATV